jgi:hypothetical protein
MSSVPSPKITPQPPAGGSLIGNYEGSVFAVGATLLNIDLTYLPLEVRKSVNFQEQLRVQFASKDANLSTTTGQLLPVDFFDTVAEGINAYVKIPVVSVTGAEECAVQVDPTHSIIR